MTSTVFGTLGGSYLPLSRQDVHTGHVIYRLRKDIMAAFAEPASALAVGVSISGTCSKVHSWICVLRPQPQAHLAGLDSNS